MKEGKFSMKRKELLRRSAFLTLLLLALIACSVKIKNNNITANGHLVDHMAHFDSPNESLKIDLQIHKETLSNGLRVIVVEDKRLPIAAYATFFDIGGRHEGKGTTGASHFLEHLMFKGQKNTGPENLIV